MNLYRMIRRHTWETISGIAGVLCTATLLYLIIHGVLAYFR